jgi:hypothetical protein
MKKQFTLLVFLIISTGLMGQKADSLKKGRSAGQETKGNAADSLLNSMNSDDNAGPVVIFKSSRLILSQTTRTVKNNNLNFLVIHRFGDFAGKNGGGKLFLALMM